ncbi:Proteasome assembly chaperone 2 [Lamellibrachia satsuma]|nr:Proteasome assembly chaperone 2 [Lamellibrachia satsuma]
MYIDCDTDRATKDWSGYTLIVPSVSVGNVGQLTVDLIVSTLHMDRIGYLSTDAVYPVVGNDPFSTKGSSDKCQLVTAIEVYECTDKKITVVQQRAPLVRGKRKQFVSELCHWIQTCNFTKVIIVTSSFSHERVDTQIAGTQLRFLLSPVLETREGVTLRDHLHWLELEHRCPLTGGLQDGPSSEDSGQGEIFLPGAGFAKDLFETLASADVCVALLMLFCSEGDNAMDAIQLATALNTWLSLISLKTKQSWRIPPSWKLQYGSTFEQILYD